MAEQDVRSPEEKKSAALKLFVNAQTQVELALKELLSISPVVADSNQYQAGQKIHAGIRNLIGGISGMRVS